MKQRGGGFVRNLAHAWTYADADNKARLEATFAPEFREYEALAATLAKQIEDSNADTTTQQ